MKNINFPTQPNTKMNLIHLHHPTPSRLDEWQTVLESLDWHQWNRPRSVSAAFAKAIWLDISAPQAVETVETLCRQFDPELEPQRLWDVWFETLRLLNNYNDEIELTAA